MEKCNFWNSVYLDTNKLNYSDIWFHQYNGKSLNVKPNTKKSYTDNFKIKLETFEKVINEM